MSSSRISDRRYTTYEIYDQEKNSMDAFFGLFVGHPIILLVFAALFFIGYHSTCSNSNLRARALLAPAVLWLLWAVWEWGIMQFSPEVNIRVDLLLIIPIVLIASVASVVLLFRKRKD